MPGRPLSAEECDRLWQAWTPAEVAERLSGAPPCWYIAAGWALDLFAGGLGREHGDLEIGVPRARFAEIMAAFPGFEWDIIGEGRAWPFPEELAADTEGHRENYRDAIAFIDDPGQRPGHSDVAVPGGIGDGGRTVRMELGTRSGVVGHSGVGSTSRRTLPSEKPFGAQSCGEFPVGGVRRMRRGRAGAARPPCLAER